jgi:hypothetical protein
MDEAPDVPAYARFARRRNTSRPDACRPGDLRLVLSSPASRAVLRATGTQFRNDIVDGVGGEQVLIEDPSGNPVELFEPTSSSRLDSPTSRGSTSCQTWPRTTT